MGNQILMEIYMKKQNLGIQKEQTRKTLKKISVEQPQQTQREIFYKIDQQGVNVNPSEQQNYPGIQKHKT